MTATFEIMQEDIIVNRYQEPLSVNDIQRMTRQDDDYAIHHKLRIIVVADFTQIKAFPPGLLTLGLHPSMNNPMRNPQIGTILVVCNSAFMAQLVNVVTRVVHNEKIMMVKDWNEAHSALHNLLPSYAA